MIPKLYGICGPTASGKTELALRLCERLGGEIISADSMQVYRGMDILSAKPDADELKRAKHHVIDFVPPDENYNASRFRQDAMAAIQTVNEKHALPILCGGTGLYIDALTKGIRMAEEADQELRERLKGIAAQPDGKYRLHRMLKEVDPASAAKYPINDTRRVIRSLEIFYATGKPRGEHEQEDAQSECTFDAVLFALKWDRETLYRRIDRRVDDMVARGLISEVKALLNAPEAVRETAAQAIGFKELKQALEGEISMDEAIDLTKTHSRHLAKRQETWFKRDRRVTWLETDGTNFDALTQSIADIISEAIAR